MVSIIGARGAGDASDFAGAAAVLAGRVIQLGSGDRRRRDARRPVHLGLMLAAADVANRLHFAETLWRAFAVFVFK